MPNVNDASANLINLARFFTINKNSMHTDEANDILRATSLTSSPRPVAVSFRTVNEEKKLENYLKNKNFPAFFEALESTGARVKLVASDCKVAYNEISEPIVSDGQFEAENSAKVNSLVQNSGSSKTADKNNEEIKSDVALSDNFAAADSQSGVEEYASVKYLINKFQALTTSDNNNEEINLDVALTKELVNDSQPDAEIRAQLTSLTDALQELKISDSQAEEANPDVTLTEKLTVDDSQPDTEIKAQLRSVVEQFKDLQLEELQSEEINQVIALSTDTSTASSKEICEAVAKAIGVMAEEYLDVFQSAVEKNIAFYKDFTDFIAKLSSYVGANDDKTTFNKSAFLKELWALMLVYPLNTVVPATTLYPPLADDTVKGTSKEDCVAWAKMMGLNSDSDNVIRKLDDGTYVVTIDVSPLWAIEDSANSASGSMNSAQWTSFQAALDIQKDTIQTAMQTLTQRYSNANSTFDNLVKVLSSVINSLLDCDKAFFNI